MLLKARSQSGTCRDGFDWLMNDMPILPWICFCTMHPTALNPLPVCFDARSLELLLDAYNGRGLRPAPDREAVQSATVSH
jgi:hypothetical protein